MIKTYFMFDDNKVMSKALLDFDKVPLSVKYF